MWRRSRVLDKTARALAMGMCPRQGVKVPYKPYWRELEVIAAARTWIAARPNR